MIKKIIYFSIFFFILFSHSSSYVFGACTNSCTNNASTWGNKRCLGNWLQYCNDGGWTDHTYCDYGCSNCECNSPPATATPFHCQYSDSQQRCVGYCSSGYTCTQIGTSDTCICKLPPTNTPTPPTSTLAPCDHDGNNICNTPDPVCNFTCRPNLCIGNEPVQKYVTCRTREDCDVCYDSRPTYFYDPIHCGYCGGNPVPTGCQPYACYDMNTPQCPYTNFGNCPGGIGNCDNCGGQDCGTCDDHSPPGTTPVPTSPPGCVADCVNPNVSPCITTTCHNQTCQGNCGQYCYGTLPNDCSCAANLCSDQTCTGTCGGTCTGQVTCVTPTFNNLTIRRSDWFYTDRDASNGSDIMDGNNRIHICDPFIANHTNPRRLIYVVFVSTSNGWQDIASVRIRWLKDNVVKNMARITGYHDGDPANGELPDNQDVYHLIVNFNDSDNHSGNAYDHQVNVTSVKGNRSTGWINADRLLKVWDCNVSVSGGFFDSSGQPAPTPTSYVIEASGGAYTPAQEALNQSPEALAQQERFQRWLDYWVQFDNRPFTPGSVDIHKKYVYNDPQNPTEVIMLLEVGGPDYKNATFLPPHNADGPIDYPPEVSGSEIAPGLGPMEIDLNKDGTVTRAYQGTLARFDSQGNLVETLVGNHWEAVEQYPIDINKIHNFPKSYEYMVANLDEFVEFPDPFVDPDGFNASVEKLKTIIGDHTQRERNYVGSTGDQPDFYVADAYLSPNQLEGQPEIAYFQHQGVVYPMIGLNVYGTDSVPGMGSTRTLLVILYNGRGAPEGTDVIQTLSDGGHVRSIWLNKTEQEVYPDNINRAIRMGIVPVNDGTYNQIIWGFGGIQTEEGFQKMINGN